MASEAAPQRPDGYRFGIFELELRNETLLRNGRPIKIQNFPLAVLLALLESSGRVILREELKARLWGDQTHVDFDNGLQVAVAKLREALGENASKPKFVRTVPGKGYQFIGTAEPLFGPPIPLPQSASEHAAPASVPMEASREIPADFTQNRRRMALGAALLCGVVAASLLVLRHDRIRALVTGNDLVLIGAFVNSTGNPQLDGVLTTAFRVKLQESPYLHILAGTRPESTGQLSSTMASELSTCRELEGQVYIRGELRNHSSGYQVSIAEYRCSDGHQLSVHVGNADSIATILPVLGDTIEALRRGMGEPTDKQGRFNTSITQATTSSPAAMKAFSQGDQRRAEGMNNDAIADYKLAVALDPQFALAYGRLGAMYSNLGDDTLSNQFFTTAYQLRDRITDRERLYIAGHYFADVTGELQQGIATYKLWRGLYPYDEAPDNNLALLYLRSGQPERALEMSRGAISLNPTDTNSLTTIAQAYLELHDYTDLNRLCRSPIDRARGTTLFHSTCFWSGYAQGDETATERELQWAKGQRGEPLLLDDQAWVLLSRGKLKDSRQLFLTAVQKAEKSLGNEVAAEIELDAALMEADIGSSTFAALDARRALELDSSAMTKGVAALVLARCGDITQAESEVRQAARQAPLNTILNSVVLSSARAAIDLHTHNPGQAIQVLDAALPYDFNITISFAPIYYRGLAYEDDHQPQKANAEFTRIIQNKDIDPGSDYIFLAKVEQVHALEMSGNHEAAMRLAKQLTLQWEDADPDFPLTLRIHKYASEFQLIMNSATTELDFHSIYPQSGKER